MLGFKSGFSDHKLQLYLLKCIGIITTGIWLTELFFPASASTWLARWSACLMVTYTMRVRKMGVTSMTGCSTGPPYMQQILLMLYHTLGIA